MKRFWSSVGVVLTVAATYEWFVDEAIVSEAIAAIMTGAAVFVALAYIERASPMRARFLFAGLRPFVTRVLPAVLSENVELLGPVLWRTLVRRERIRGRWIALRYSPPSSDEAGERGRRAMVIFGSNLTPNALPLDLDSGEGRLILHQLVHRREAAANDSEFPM